MKLEINEFDQLFQVSFRAETMEEAAFLVRLGINHTNKLQLRTCAFNKGTVSCDIEIGNRLNNTCEVPRAK